jgi:hypothetical protein
MQDPTHPDSRDVPAVRDGHGHNTVILERPDGGFEIRRVDELVLEAFAGRCPPGHVIKHINGDQGDDCLVNLCYAPGGPYDRA